MRKAIRAAIFRALAVLAWETRYSGGYLKEYRDADVYYVWDRWVHRLVAIFSRRTEVDPSSATHETSGSRPRPPSLWNPLISS